MPRFGGSGVHHRKSFAKFDLKDFNPPSYDRTVWNFSEANFDHIKRAVDLFDWELALTDSDVNEQVSIFNNAITNLCQILFLTKKLFVTMETLPG